MVWGCFDIEKVFGLLNEVGIWFWFVFGGFCFGFCFDEILYVVFVNGFNKNG